MVALRGCQVLEVAQGLAGPFCGQYLAEAGADVIKVEPLGGDRARGWGPPFQGEVSAVFLALNRGKRSLALDLGREEGREVLGRLLSLADVVVEDLTEEAAEVPAGADGLLVPDLPLEESGDLDSACRRHGLRLIPFLAPTSTEERIARVAAADPAFIYCVSVTGVTGVRERLSDRLSGMVERIRRHTRAPLAVGFGISGPAQARAAAALADAVIVGSAVVRLVEEGGTPEEVAARVGRFIAEMKAAISPGAA